MKKAICMLLAVLMILGLAACGSEKQEATTENEGFSPALDTSTECNITVAGGYDNFEALEAVLFALAYAAFLQGAYDAGPVIASLIGVFEPVSGAVISALWLGTVFSGWDILGGLCIIIMMILVALKK